MAVPEHAVTEHTELLEYIVLLKRGISRLENMADRMCSKDHAPARYDIQNAIEDLAFALRHDDLEDLRKLFTPAKSEV